MTEPEPALRLDRSGLVFGKLGPSSLVLYERESVVVEKEA